MIKRILLLSLVTLLVVCLCGCQRAAPEQIETVPETLPSEVLTLELTGPELPIWETLAQYTGLRQLDARNVPLTLAQYDQLREIFPNCEILWLVPFQDHRLDPAAAELTVTALSDEDLEAIAHFPNLQKIHAEECRDYDNLMVLKATYPQIAVTYNVELGDELLPWDTETYTAENADIAEIAGALPYLPGLKEVFFVGETPANEEIYDIMCRYPDISFQWELTLFGITAPNTATTLILSEIPMEGTSEVESYLKYFPDLERVEMCDCGIPSDDMAALSERYPEIRFVWTIKVGNGTIRTDTTAFIPYKLGYHISRPLYDKDCTELKYCIDMVCLDMGHMRVKDFSFLANMPKLKYLIVADTPCKDFSVLADLKELIYLEIFVTDFTEHELLLGLTNLQDLNLGTTPMNDISVLKQMTWLQRLWIPGTRINREQLQELHDALPNTKIVYYAQHSTDQGWRNHQNYRDMRDLLGMFYMD